MYKLIIFLIISAITLNSCTSVKQNKNSKYLDVDIKKTYSIGEAIKIRVKNISDENIIIYSPTKPNLQQKENKIWKNLRILNCPCDAPCMAPPEKIELTVNNEITLTWDQKESFCGKIADAGIRETIYKKAEKGSYRIIINYKIYNENMNVTKEFIIK
ncbi:MAG: hypothetical protein JXR51_03625 [Bacteroidales bacterium]|nr:hypothetical protein [Bacteroidales bacterium]